MKWPEQRDHVNFPLIMASIELGDLIESQDWTQCMQWYDLLAEFNDLTRRQYLQMNDDWVKSRSGKLVADDVTSTYHWMGRTMMR